MKDLVARNYVIYKIRNSACFAVVAPFYQRDIRQCAAEYQGLGAVPEGRSVRAILFGPASQTQLLALQEEIELPINRLEFDTGSFTAPRS